MGTHILKLMIDDSKIRELETRLGKSVGVNQKGGLESVLGSDAKKNLGKLGGIAIGVGSAVTALDKLIKISTESSGHFQATFKIWDTAMRLIFRPIGDTIGLVLRPFALMMIKWAIPFYQKFADNIPEILEGGEKISQGKVSEGVGDIKGAWLDILFGEGAGDWQREVGGKAQEFHDWLFDTVSSLFNPIPKAYGDTGEAVEDTSNSMMIFSGTLERITGQLDKSNESGNSFIGTLIAIGEELRRRLSIEGNKDAGVIGGGGRDDFGTGSKHKHFGGSTKAQLSRKLYERFNRLGVSEEKIFNFLEERDLPTNVFGDPNIGGNRNSGQGVNINSTIRVEGAVDENTMNRIAEKSAELVTNELKKFPGRFG